MITEKIKDFAHAVDIFLFIDPIDPICQECTPDILSILNHLDYKIYFHIVPYHNLKTVSTYLKKHHLPLDDLTIRNNITQLSYSLSLFYKAANFQGKRKARQFLQAILEFSQRSKNRLSREQLLHIAEISGLDIPMLIEDAASDTVKTLYKKDQILANQFDICETPSVIIFNSNQSSGVLLTGDNISLDYIYDIIAHAKTSKSNKLIKVSL